MKIKEILKYLMPEDLLFDIQKKKIKKNHKAEMKIISSNVRFKNMHKGQRCFILGNGPSLNQISLEILANEVTFSVNQLPRRKDFPDLKTNYHMWADERFFDINDSRPEDVELLNVMKMVNAGNNKPIVFYKTAALQMIKERGLDRDLKIAYFYDGACDPPSINYELEFDKVLPRYSTVVHYLIILAVYMGFSEIYLLGCDCTGIINTVQSRLSNNEIKYGYPVSEAERKRMQRSNSVFPIEDELRWYANIFDEYEVLYKYCRIHNVKLINATEGSLLESIPYVKLDNIL